MPFTKPSTPLSLQVSRCQRSARAKKKQSQRACNKAVCQNGITHKALLEKDLRFPLVNLHQFFMKVERKKDDFPSVIITKNAAERLPSTAAIDEPFTLAPLAGRGWGEGRTGPALRPSTGESTNAVIHWRA